MAMLLISQENQQQNLKLTVVNKILLFDQKMSVKQGLGYLIEQARQRGYRPQYDQKAIIIPIFSFIIQLMASIKGFLNTREYDCWCTYFLDQHLYDRTLHNMIKSWQKLKETSLECHLLQKLLTVRNRNKLRLYLKARKYILQTAAENAMLDEVLLDLQGSIAIIHKIFINQEIRKALIKGMKNIFLAFKISQAKLYSSVLIEYLLAVYDSIIRIESEEATISGQFSLDKPGNQPCNQNYQELFSSISNFQSTIHNQNGLYKKNNFTHSHLSHKKYQIIEKKFLPLKQTSSYVSNAHSQKFSFSKHKYSHSKDKSLFYDFISNKNDTQEYLSQKSNALKIQPSIFSQQNQTNPFQKQQPFQDKLYMQPSRDNSSSLTPQPKKQISQQKKSVSPQPVSRFIKKQPQVNLIKAEPTKKFSIGWFSNKFFQTDNEQQSRQSFLLKSKQKILKKAQEKRRQNTEKYEIENHLLNTSSRRIYDSKIQKDYAAESDKSEEFDKMVNNNQEFKEKMLKKSHIEIGSGSDKDFNQTERRNFRANVFSNQYKNSQNNFSKVDFDLQNDGVVQFTSNFGTGDKKETSGDAKNKSYSPQKEISSGILRRMKKRNQMILNSLENQQYYESVQKQRNSQNQQDEQAEVYSFKKNKPKIQNSPQFKEKPQIIHKSIGDKKIAYFSKYSNNQNQTFSQKNHSFKDQLHQQRSSYQMGKMKSLLRIIDDYRQNAVQNEYNDKQLEISESFCKKSRFQSQKSMQSIQELF